MATRDRRVHQGRRRGVRLRADVGNELREARLQGGLSQDFVGAALGWSHSKVGRAERGVLGTFSIADLAAHAAVVGLAVSVRLYPDGSPVRDAAHLALIARFRSRLATGMKLATEVPLPIAGDGRAWDAVVYAAGAPIGVEAETRLSDVQALTRRIALKQRDGHIATVVLVVADTHRNRRILCEHQLALAVAFPVSGRSAIRALGRGRAPAGSAILVL
jgi:transcriptional regulator with XRE-family HTH domain